MMAANLEKQLIDKVRALPPSKQRVALSLLEKLADDSGSAPHETTKMNKQIWQVIEDINTGLPEDSWNEVPTDGSFNLDHYLYGAPKRQQ